MRSAQDRAVTFHPVFEVAGVGLVLGKVGLIGTIWWRRQKA